jgi:hypothetical protein
MTEEFKIVPKRAPARRGRTKSDLYHRIVRQFVESGLDEGLIEVAGKKPSTLQQQLIKAVKDEGAQLRVKRSGDEVYLSKRSSGMN